MQTLGWEAPEIGPNATEEDKYNADVLRATTLRDNCFKIRDRFNSAHRHDNSSLPLYLHVHYHPLDPHQKVIQKAFCDTMLQPDGNADLLYLHNNRGKSFNVSRIVVAYHRPKSIGDKVARTRFVANGRRVSQVIIEDHQSSPHQLPHPVPGYTL